MNTIYRIVWNATAGKWIVASELAKGRKKKSSPSRAVLLIASAVMGLSAAGAMAQATNPSGSVGAGGADNVAIGNGSYAECVNPLPGYIVNPDYVGGCVAGTAVGKNAFANQAGTAIGDHANTSGSHGVALGAYSKAAIHGTAVGTSAMATGSDSFAGGFAAEASGSHATAVGKASNAATLNSVAFGRGAQAGIDASGNAVGSGQTALGAMAKAVGSRGTAVGLNTSAAGIDSFAGASNASATGTASVAVGVDTAANNNRSVALGPSAVAGVAGGSGQFQTALGNQSQALADRSIAVGSAAKVDEAAQYGVAIGGRSNVTATGVNSVALGQSSVANRANTISVGAAGSERQIVNVSAGTQDTDAVNLSQLKNTAGSVAGTLGGDVAVKADGTLTRPTYTVADLSNGGNKTVDNVGDALGQLNANTTHLDGRVTTNEGDIVDIRNQLGNGSIGLVKQDAATRDITVAAGTDGGRVDFAGTDGARKLAGVEDGELSETSAEAVNGSQLFETNERVTKNEGDIVTIGDRVTNTETSITNLDGRVTTNEGNIVTIGNRVTNAETNITHLDGRVTTNEGDIVDIRNQLGSGSIGLVQQAGASAAVTVAAATGGAIVDFTGTDGTRQLKGVSKGEDATDAVNVAQLRDELASASAGDTRYFKANGANDGTDDAIATGDKAVAIGANAKGGGASAVALGDGAEAMFADSVAVGARAHATYASAVAIGADSNANSSTAVAVGSKAKAANTNDTAIGAGAQATMNSTAIGQGSLASNGSTSVGQAAMAMGNNSIAIGQGAGIVPSAANSIAVGSGARANAANAVALGAGSVATRTNTVSVGSVGNERQIANVADGTEDTDAVNLRQLKSAGLVDDNGSLMDAVVYDAGSSRSSITLGGVAGTTITNVMAGLVAPGSMDAINGSQLWGVQDQINKLGDRVSIVENGSGGSPNPNPNPGPSNPVNPGSGSPHFAANGDADKPATATGNSSVAAGEGAAATGNSSTAIGASSSATGNNSVAIGAGSVADSDNAVSVGSVGNERRIANVAAGTQRTDAANVGQLQDAMSNLQDWTQGQVNGLSKKVDNVQRQANRGIAASAALVNNMPYLPGKVTLNAGVAAYRGQSAMGVGVSRWNDSGRFNVNAGISAAQGDSPIFRLGVGVVLGD